MLANLSHFKGLAELKSRLLFLLLGILVYRLGVHIPLPGLDAKQIAIFFAHQQSSVLGLFNLFSGGAFMRFSILALGVMPYISASIIIQLFSSVSPHLEQLKKEGEAGRRKISQYTRYFTLIIATMQSLAMVKFLIMSGIAIYSNFAFYIITVLSLVTGTMFLMWLGEQITEKGIGNGISLIIFAGIVAGLPSALGRSLEQFRQGQLSFIVFLFILAIVLGVVYFVVYVERAQRKIAVHYAQRHQVRGSFSSQTSHLPLKINIAGVIPPIFASSLILLPASIAEWLGKSSLHGFLSTLSLMLSQGQPLHIILLSVGIIFFSFFFTALVFNPAETAENLKKSGAFIQGIRPGDQTTKYIDYVMTRITLIGALYVTLVCLLPEFLNIIWHVPFYFGGTSLLIIVVVIMDFIAQVQAHLMSRQYQSLMKKSKLKR